MGETVTAVGGPERHRIKHVADVAVSNVDKKTLDGQIAVRLCNYLDVYNHDYVTADLLFMDATASAEQVARFSLHSGDVLITKDSETPDDIGAAALVRGPLDSVVCGYHLAILRPRGAAIYGPFLHWAMSSTLARSQLSSRATGITRFGLRQSAIKDVVIPVPELSDQRATADYLERVTARIDALIEKKLRLIDLMHSRRAAVIGKLLLGFGTRNPSQPLRDWGKGLPTEWPVTPLGKCLTRATYGFTNPMPSVDDGPYLLTANDIGDGAILYSTARRTSEEAFVGAITDKSRPRLGDVLVTKDGTLGRVACADGARACINQSVALLRPSEVLNPEYLAALLRSAPYQELMVFQAGGTTIKHIYVTRIVKMPIPLPSLARQAELTRAVQTMDHSHDDALKRLDQSVRLLKERRQAIITAAVSGQLDVPRAA